MRLFVAVVPPAPQLDELGAAVARLRKLPGADGLRWTGRGGWHYTLAFCGTVSEDVLPEFSERLGRAAGRTGAFPLSISGGGHFGNGVLWAGAAGGTEELRRLAARADAAARRSGIPMEEPRRFTPHLTLARARRRAAGPTADAKSGAPLGTYADVLRDFAGTPWRVSEFVLFRSHLPAGGTPGAEPRYETLATWPLGDAGRLEQAR
ncbi:RNA 2',3'-cyclic phosphodiesterase [Streptomyces sp. NPDC047315]|uniref:RNA 2',3'-cyclic phosphodiesterase n=1 Tax=Streptomyces sp. NPDC047315 TaxID=3155142 RepID=UPI0033DCA30E